MSHAHHRRVPRHFAAFILAVACLGVAHATPEEQLRRLEDQRREAIRGQDFAALSRIYAAEFVGVTGGGQMVTRDQLFRVFAQADPKLRFVTDEVRIVVHGDTAVFFGRLVGSSESGTQLFASRFSHVFVKRDETWVCVAGQSTPLPTS
jgi:ketosteroid isomerase-like protein